MDKLVVAHPAQQHSYKTAEVLEKSNQLEAYITSVYLKKGTITFLISKLLKGDLKTRTLGRNNKNIPDDKIIVFCELSGLFLLFLQRVKPLKLFYRIWWDFHNYRFNKKLKKYMRKSSAKAVIVYDQVSSGFMKKSKKDSYKTILDMSAPYFNYMEDIFNKNIKRSLNLEQKYRVSKLEKNSLVEISNANYFFVASDFSKKSLVENNVSENKIIKLSYGIENEAKLEPKQKLTVPYKFLFVGRFNEEKGAHLFIDFLDKLAKETDIEFRATALGAFDNKSELYNEGKNYIEFMGHIPKKEMFHFYREHDFLVFPSLADGFGLSVTESLSVGTPVICSENAGASELIIDFFNGKTFDPLKEQSLFKEFKRLLKSDYAELSRNSKSSLSELTWENYSRKLQLEIKKIC